MKKIATYISSLQQNDGSFMGDKYGEIDTRFTYCALNSLKILNSLHLINIDLAYQFILSCQNYDGGFGAIPGAETHSGQIFFVCFIKYLK